MMYQSTRKSILGGGQPRPFSEIMLAALAPDGGLYVPVSTPQIDMAVLAGKSYQEIAFEVIAPFVDIPHDDLRGIIARSYDETVFRTPDVTPLVSLNDNFSVLELFHGPTLAFKDIALQFLGHIFDYILERNNQSITIIGATSGDTGSAALEAFRGKKNVKIAILHPYGRTSDIQRRQMTSITDDNVYNMAIEGTFDDAQSIVKRALNDADIQNHRVTTAVNSINWARIVAQIVYYVVTCVRLGEQGIDRVSFAVPTGNFGNIYAGYMARKMGAPIDDLIIGSNRNDILTRFFETGAMSAGKVTPSNSPSMDIQISSNFERFLFDLVGQNGAEVARLMNEFAETGTFTVTADQFQSARAEFQAFRCDDAGTVQTIRDIYAECDYILDPHTAVGVSAVKQSVKQAGALSRGHVVTLACAHPAKFSDTVRAAIGIDPALPAFLNDLYDRKEKFQIIENDYNKIKDFLLKV
jgi:threonine synthase